MAQVYFSLREIDYDVITNECYVIQFIVKFDNNGAVENTDFHSRELTKCNKMLIMKKK